MQKGHATFIDSLKLPQIIGQMFLYFRVGTERDKRFQNSKEFTIYKLQVRLMFCGSLSLLHGAADEGWVSSLGSWL